MVRPVIKRKKAVAALEAKMIREIRSAGNISRIKLARSLSLAPATAGYYVNRLLNAGYLLEGERSASSSGRPATKLHLNPEAGAFIGVDVEARTIKVLMMDFAQSPPHHSHTKIPEKAGAERIVEIMQELVEEIIEKSELRILGIGLGLPGLVDIDRGLALHYDLVDDWVNLPFVEIFSSKYAVPVHIENSIRSMAVAEKWFGAGRECNDFMCFGIRSGIAAGIVSGGKVQHGSSHFAGEIGWLPCPVPEPLQPGNQATKTGSESPYLELQKIASASAVIQRVRSALADGNPSMLSNRSTPVELPDIIAAAKVKDPLSEIALRQAGEAIGWVVGQMTCALNPEKVILAGEMSDWSPRLVKIVKEVVSSICRFPPDRLPSIVASHLGEYAGALGAAAISMQEWQMSRVSPEVETVNIS